MPAVISVNRQIGYGEIIIEQMELMNQLAWGAVFMHPTQGLFLCDEHIQVSKQVAAFISYRAIFYFNCSHLKL